MPEAYNLSEVRLVQERAATSAANAETLDVGSPGPGGGKIWTVMGFGYAPSANEQQICSISKVTRTGAVVSLINPVLITLTAAAIMTFLEQGMWLQLFPGEFIRVVRQGHAVGSTMSATMQYIESDLPLYEYIEPQLSARIKRAATSLVQRSVGSGGGGARPAAPMAPRGGMGPREK